MLFSDSQYGLDKGWARMERMGKQGFLGGFALAVSLLLPASASALAAETRPLFRAVYLENGDPKPLKLEIRADFSQILGKRYGYGTDKKNRTRVPLEIRLLGEESKRFPAVQTGELSGRGALRGNECPFPPLKIEFKGRPKAPSYFQGIDEIKVVTHCGKSVLARKDSLQEQLLKEFTIYRLHALAAAPKSFQTRLVEVHYIDTSGQHADMLEYAIFVEDLSDLTKRLGVKRLFSQRDQELKTFDESYLALHVGQFSARKWVEMLIFQMLVWNYDFEIGHNLKGIADVGGWEPVPYDFDYSELFYQQPQEMSTDVMMLYPYQCLSDSQVEEIVAASRSIAQKMLRLIRATRLLNDASKERGIANIESVVRYLERMPRPNNLHEILPCPERR